jgi:hypothetical protein
MSSYYIAGIIPDAARKLTEEGKNGTRDQMGGSCRSLYKMAGWMLMDWYNQHSKNVDTPQSNLHV